MEIEAVPRPLGGDDRLQLGKVLQRVAAQADEDVALAKPRSLGGAGRPHRPDHDAEGRRQSELVGLLLGK